MTTISSPINLDSLRIEEENFDAELLKRDNKIKQLEEIINNLNKERSERGRRDEREMSERGRRDEREMSERGRRDERERSERGRRDERERSERGRRDERERSERGRRVDRERSERGRRDERERSERGRRDDREMSERNLTYEEYIKMREETGKGSKSKGSWRFYKKYGDRDEYLEQYEKSKAMARRRRKHKQQQQQSEVLHLKPTTASSKAIPSPMEELCRLAKNAGVGNQNGTNIFVAAINYNC